VYAGNFRDAPASLPFRALMWLCALFLLIFALEISVTTLALRAFLSYLIYLPGAFIAPAILLMAIQYTGHSAWVTRWRLSALLLIPAITVVLALSYPLHTLFRYDPQIDTSHPLTSISFSRGPWFWVNYGYGSALTVCALAILILSLRDPALRRQNTLLLIFGMLLPALGDVPTVLRIAPMPSYIWTPMLLVCIGALYGWALLRGQIFTVVPIARGAVMDHIEDLVIVLDNNGRIADFNRAAQTICGLSQGDIGATLEALPPSWGDLLRRYRSTHTAKAEVTIGTGTDQRIYDLAISTIQNQIRQPLGQLFILHDVTTRKRSEDLLRKSEERFRQMAEIMPVPMVLTRLSDSTYQYVNKLAGDQVGLSQAEMIGMEAIDFYVEPSARQIVLDAIRKTGSIRSFEAQLKRVDGSTFWALFSATLATVDDEQVILAGIIDISARKQIEEAMRESERRYRLLTEDMKDVVWILDIESMYFTYVSPSVERLRGYTADEVMAKPVYDALMPNAKEHLIRLIQQRSADFLADQGGTPKFYINEVEQPCKDGSSVWTEIVDYYSFSEETGKVELHGVTRDISERKLAEQKLRQINEELQVQLEEIQELQSQLHEQAMRDVLTGLFNRRYMQEILDQTLAHATREQSSVCVMMIDIDHFKQLNDDHGHKAGDLVLQAMGSLLHSHTRQMDTACRYGGEEFVVIMPTATLDTALRRADELRQKFAAMRVEFDDLQLQSTISIGVAIFPSNGDHSDALLRSADQALYMAKATGRNRMCAADKNLGAVAKLLTTN